MHFTNISAGHHLLPVCLLSETHYSYSAPSCTARYRVRGGFADRARQVAASDSESVRALVPWQLNSCHSGDRSASARVFPMLFSDESAFGWGLVAFLSASLLRLWIILLLVVSSLSDAASALQWVSHVFSLEKAHSKPTVGIVLNWWTEFTCSAHGFGEVSREEDGWMRERASDLSFP